MIGKIFFLEFFMLSIVAFAQEGHTGAIEDARVIIEKDKPLTLPEATRLYRKTEVLPIKQAEEVAIGHQFSSPVFEPEPIKLEIKQQDYKGMFARGSYGNYVGAGFGNYISPLIQASFSKQRRGREIGVWAKHESFMNGPVRKKESGFAATAINLGGTFDLDKWIFSPTLAFDRNSFYYYGHDKSAASSLPFVTDKTHFNSFQLAPEFQSVNEKGMNCYVKPAVKFGWLGVPGTSFGRELNFSNALGVDFNINDKIKGYVLGDYRFLSYGGGFKSNRNLVSVTSGGRFESGRLRGRAGAGLAGANDSTGSKMNFYVFPDFFGRFLVSDAFSVTLKLTGNVVGTSLHDTFSNCWFLEDSLILRNQIRKADAKLSVMYAINGKLSIEPYLRVEKTNQKSFYHVSKTDSSRFLLLYDDGEFTQTDMGARIKYLGKKAIVSVEMRISNYKTATFAEAWYMPKNQLEISYSRQFADNLDIMANLLLLNGIVGMSPVTEQAMVLDPIVDLGFDANYRINEKWGAFLRCRNLLNRDYERYLNYPVIGINGKLGFFYQF